ncbi:uncharacterized protein BT62DRAFT_982887 [Guyanagaster necrorhizus]|uniref:Uncharacterized protein n=1 Tax=Guyanagaster necrorhizus TaxID=856835 RepID=A0A9P7VJK0_9AGAR|nr:uncharacterized protein BT62DRAFT_982887 [Guyanagaster necrorhizus MCA 3950]KAG7441119.1 hypothetical protein BT62DRAFT_982887 [Guyanagaster necrorhizus MCA 3950]
MLHRRRFNSLSSNENRRAPPSFAFTPPPYSHASTFRSLQIVLRVWSPSVKAREGIGRENRELEPLFGEGDRVTGAVTLDPSCVQPGRLTVTLEGTFTFFPPAAGSVMNYETRKHTFFSTSTSFQLSSSSDGTSRSTFREVFASSLRRRPSISSLNINSTPSIVERTYPFSFDLPRSCRSGEEIPPTFYSSKHAAGSPASTSRAASFSVEYKILVTWDPTAAYEYPSFLEAPILYHPDVDFQSLDGLGDQGSWLEMPLRTDRPVPFRCAITLPTNVTFPRSSSLPYFVVFTTMPRSLSLTREIASDATISVSLVRQVTITESPALPPTPPQTPSTSDEDGSRNGIRFIRLVKSSSPLISRGNKAVDESVEGRRRKPLPQLPSQAVFSESSSVYSSICIGFPKRPRHHRSTSNTHPSLQDHATLPDGLHKSKIILDKDMLPSIDWVGLSVKYFLDISILVGQDEVRDRIPIRII